VSDSARLNLSATTAQIVTEPLDLLTYQRDCSVLRPGHAEAMVRPTTRADVAAVLTSAAQRGLPVYVRGAGTMYAGGVIPRAGGLVLDMTGLDRILDIDLERGVVIVEPGVRFGQLSKALQAHGMTIGIIPVTGPTATIGGAASAHALGTGSAKFQSFADEVVGLEVVLADGRVMRTGSAAAGEIGFFHRFGMGPDLTGLFLGGDATLGVITAIALWLHPIPAYRITQCYGFPSPAAATQFVAALQTRELTRHVWYASGYEGATVKGRVLGAYPETEVASLPQFCIGLDYGGDEVFVRHDQTLIEALCQAHGGAPYPLFDEVYFRRLRNEDIYWYGYAGYFSRSRCVILMSSLPTPKLPNFLRALDELRREHAQFAWGGGVLAFYDEAEQWPQAEAAAQAAAATLVAAGCVPYKTGKIWANEVRGFTAYHTALTELKACFDPHGILSPGNLGLDSKYGP
jgi:FAD/FMN-containing dehydrogenase